MKNPVKWIGADGGWKVGEYAMDRHGFPNRDCCPVDGVFYQVQHAHTRELEWVQASNLTVYVVPQEYK